MAAVNPAQPLPTMITFSTYQSSMSRKSAKVAGGGSSSPLLDVNFGGAAALFSIARGAADPPLNAIAAHVIWPMPELAEVEWFRKQWDVGHGVEIVDLSLHPRNRIFRSTDVRELRQRLIGEKLLSAHARGKRMLFKFSGGVWLGIHLGMTGKIRVESANYRPGKHDHLVLLQRERALVFTDSRQFGRVRFHHGSDEPDWWKS